MNQAHRYTFTVYAPAINPPHFRLSWGKHCLAVVLCVLWLTSFIGVKCSCSSVTSVIIIMKNNYQYNYSLGNECFIITMYVSLSISPINVRWNLRR